MQIIAYNHYVKGDFPVDNMKTPKERRKSSSYLWKRANQMHLIVYWPDFSAKPNAPI